MAAPIRLSAYAKIRGVSAEAVRQAVLKGRLSQSVVLVKDKPWIADVLLANREWELNTKSEHMPKHLREPMTLGSMVTAPARAAHNRATSKPKSSIQATAKVDLPVQPPPGEFNPEDPAAIDPMTGVPKRIVSQARKEYFDAMHAQAKAELLAGSQVNREEVTRAAFNVAREVRDALFLIKDRLADELATMTDANKIGAYLDTEFRNALSKLAEGIVIERPDLG